MYQLWFKVNNIFYMIAANFKKNKKELTKLTVSHASSKIRPIDNQALIKFSAFHCHPHNLQDT